MEYLLPGTADRMPGGAQRKRLYDQLLGNEPDRRQRDHAAKSGSPDKELPPPTKEGLKGRISISLFFRI